MEGEGKWEGKVAEEREKKKGQREGGRGKAREREGGGVEFAL